MVRRALTDVTENRRGLFTEHALATRTAQSHTWTFWGSGQFHSPANDTQFQGTLDTHLSDINTSYIPVFLEH